MTTRWHLHDTRVNARRAHGIHYSAGVPTTQLAELERIERVLARGAPHLHVELACRVTRGPDSWPVHAITLGNPDPALPAVALVGGVHGLERIGAHVVIEFLAHLVERLAWDATLHELLQQLRLLFLPLVNPGGMARGMRANPGGVDLMRNAPLDAGEPVPFLLGGHRISRRGPRRSCVAACW